MCICWWMNCVNIRMHGAMIKIMLILFDMLCYKCWCLKFEKRLFHIAAVLPVFVPAILYCTDFSLCVCVCVCIYIYIYLPSHCLLSILEHCSFTCSGAEWNLSSFQASLTLLLGSLILFLICSWKYGIICFKGVKCLVLSFFFLVNIYAMLCKYWRKGNR